jgi:hypothetical protein
MIFGLKLFGRIRIDVWLVVLMLKIVHFRELSKGRDGGKAEPSLPRSERRLLQIVVRRDHVFQDSYLQVGLRFLGFFNWIAGWSSGVSHEGKKVFKVIICRSISEWNHWLTGRK